MGNLLFTGSQGDRRAEIRETDDGGYMVFTWSDFGGTVGIVGWRERDAQEWRPAFYAAVNWLSKAPLVEVRPTLAVEALRELDAASWLDADPCDCDALADAKAKARHALTVFKSKE